MYKFIYEQAELQDEVEEMHRKNPGQRIVVCKLNDQEAWCVATEDELKMIDAVEKALG